MLTVLPAGTTFSMRRSLFSTSIAFFGSLLVTTSTKGCPALTLTSAGSNFWLAAVSGTSAGLSAARAAGTPGAAATRTTGRSRGNVTSHFIRGLLGGRLVGDEV